MAYSQFVKRKWPQMNTDAHGYRAHPPLWLIRVTTDEAEFKIRKGSTHSNHGLRNGVGLPGSSPGSCGIRPGTCVRNRRGLLTFTLIPPWPAVPGAVTPCRSAS